MIFEYQIERHLKWNKSINSILEGTFTTMTMIFVKKSPMRNILIQKIHFKARGNTMMERVKCLRVDLSLRIHQEQEAVLTTQVEMQNQTA
jgi:hypothetical protein